MKKISLSILLFFVLTFQTFAAVELDTDGNQAIDINRGGTNAKTAGAALSNLGGQPYDADLDILSSGSFSQKRALIEAFAKPVLGVDALRTTTADFDGDCRYLVYHTASGDGGHGIFKWDSASTTADDNGVTIAVAGVVTGRWVRQLNGFVTPEMFGGDIEAAAIYCTENRYTIFGNGTYTIDSTLDLFCFGDLSQATINVDATVVNPAIRVHATSLATPINIELPMVNNTGHTAGDGWIGYDTSVGVSIDNLYNSDVYIPQVLGFGIGAYVGGTTSGNSYNTYRIGELRNNKVNLKVGPKGAGGWANDNTFHVGRCRHDTSEANGLAAFAGTRNILVTAEGLGNRPNNNLFIKPCVEAGSITIMPTEFMIDLVDAATNTFIQPRWETAHPGGPTLRMESSVAGYCAGNVFLNNGTYKPVITKVGTVTANTVIGSGKGSQSFDSGGDGVSFSNGYSDTISGPHIQGFKASTTAMGKLRTATDWVYRIFTAGLSGKRDTDAYDRLKINWQTAGIYMGAGTVEPTAGIQSYGNTQLDVTNGTRLKVQGTWDGGYLMMGTYALWVDSTGDLRIKNGAPSSDTDGTVIGTQL